MASPPYRQQSNFPGVDPTPYSSPHLATAFDLAIEGFTQLAQRSLVFRVGDQRLKQTCDLSQALELPSQVSHHRVDGRPVDLIIRQMANPLLDLVQLLIQQV